MSLSLTLIIIIITCIISFMAFSNHKIIDDLTFYPPAIRYRNQWYRFITCGFIHADTPHLAFNMLSLYFFGEGVEASFDEFFGERSKALFIGLYLLALVVCLIPTYFKNIDNSYYTSLGASGAVSAVVFTSVFIHPLYLYGFFIIPPIIPGYIFGPIYLIGSSYMAKRGGDHINHSAHFWGAVFGVVYLIITCYFLSDERPVQSFIDQVSSIFN
ncbi:rhomboid family intramembrane serine protease [Foetidibacter luteolus]|uniref:rhomboid family intramembrane serine protease n=1 Tax=Foetidibacter luteolus TaxID=2608880 RepID=UPI00129A174A|nr:rhomboid family intramembrane serine protease [Foetidibacter luteolus]